MARKSTNFCLTLFLLPTKDDILNVNGSSLKIKDEPKADIGKFQKVFAKTFDNQKDVKQEVDKINKKTLSKLFKTQHKGSSAITFAEVGGLKELKDALKKEIIYPIRYPQAYENIELNHGFILHGAPGTGKTHIARALANEAGANFIGLNGLELESKWAGEAEENWRNLFSQAKENQPSIIFLDEFGLNPYGIYLSDNAINIGKSWVKAIGKDYLERIYRNQF